VSLLVPDTTRYDVNLRVLGFPVRVHPGFWLVHVGIAAFLAVDEAVHGRLGPVVVFLICFTCTAGAVLAHELGHVLAGRRFGADGEVVLTFLGGFAGVGIEAHTRRHRILVTLAGPAVNLVLAIIGAVWLEVLRPSVDEMVAHYMANPDAPFPESYGHALAEAVALLLVCANAPLAVFNLIPVKPLDGGQIAEEALGWYRGGDRPVWEGDADWWKRG
jgi:Zn-dependent protease